jgi:hypothetical protein
MATGATPETAKTTSPAKTAKTAKPATPARKQATKRPKRKADPPVPAISESVLPEPSDDQVAATVQRLCTLQDKAKLDLAISVGREVVDGIYGGDIEALRSRDQKMQSLRKLAAHPDLPFSVTTLFYSVGVYELTDRLGGVHAREHLTATHYRLALALPEGDQQRLLDKAEREMWTTRKLEEAAGKLKSKGRRAGGRPPLRGVTKGVGAIHRLVMAKKDVLFDLGDVETLGPEDAHELFSQVMDVTAELERLKERLRPLMERSRAASVGATDGR